MMCVMEPTSNGKPPAAAVSCPADACVPGGTCVPGATDYSCKCNDGYSGTGTKSCQVSGPCATAKCAPEFPCVSSGESFSCQGQYADWPLPSNLPTAAHKPDYTVTTDTVLDNVTGLMWQRETPTMPSGCSSPPLCTWEEAKAFCAGLGFAGFDDWRLPSFAEWLSVTMLQDDFGYDKTAFPTPFPNGHWTSTPKGDDPEKALSSITPGTLTPNRVLRSSLYGARCVRAGKIARDSAPTHYTIDRGARTVTDNRTGLVWQEPPFPLVTQVEALISCPDGFRLPTIKEAFSILDYTRPGPVFMDPAVFTSRGTGVWTSQQDSGLTWVVFNQGSPTQPTNPTLNEVDARCVR